MAGFTAAQKRRVMALKEVQSKYDEINVEYQKELATLQSKYETKYGEAGASPWGRGGMRAAGNGGGSKGSCVAA
eukprot:170242-Chlamydomonas_euryale.AAC.12